MISMWGQASSSLVGATDLAPLGLLATVLTYLIVAELRTELLLEVAAAERILLRLDSTFFATALMEVYFTCPP